MTWKTGLDTSGEVLLCCSVAAKGYKRGEVRYRRRIKTRAAQQNLTSQDNLTRLIKHPSSLTTMCTGTNTHSYGRSEPQKQTVIKAVLENPEGSQEISVSMFFEKESRDNCLIVHMNKSATWLLKLSAAVLNTLAELLNMAQHSPQIKVYKVFQIWGETPKHDDTNKVSVKFYVTGSTSLFNLKCEICHNLLNLMSCSKHKIHFSPVHTVKVNVVRNKTESHWLFSA